jgi:phytoene/squalene synthetase
MMLLYDETCFECSKLITQKYSTSFSLGIKAFHKHLHYPIYAIYGFVRYADEIVDTFHDKNKLQLLTDFKHKTFESIDDKISLNPVLHSFQYVVNKYQIDHELINAFLRSMEMDLENVEYDEVTYKNYIYGSAEVIGLMCLRVFCDGDSKQYDSLKEQARSLGSAFQKINFLRDIKSDFEERGRTYFPNVCFTNFSEQDKTAIQHDILKDFEEGRKGIQNLPAGCRAGVYIAYIYYLELYKKVRLTSATEIANKRIRVSDKRKVWLLAQALVRNKLNII